MKWRTQYNNVPSKGEFNSLPSMTLSNQVMTVIEILDRQKRGIPVNVSKGMPVYYGDEFEMPDWQRLDLSEKQDALAKYKAQVQVMKENYVAQEAERKKLAKEQADKEFQEKFDALNKVNLEKGVQGDPQ